MSKAGGAGFPVLRFLTQINENCQVMIVCISIHSRYL
jgi:hypothetical protein